ncbi:MAG TPA: alpha/beta hydrolase, partial [Hyphomonadaceae bacterium]|nr:alpha/beta hydrolase [Hyphomonadaceae bacterium]
MNRIAFLLCAAAVGGCSTSPATPAHTYASEWLVTSGTGARISIHETSLGLAGRLVATNGAVYPVRNIAKSDGQISFIIPSLNAAYSAARQENGWSGEWIDDDGKRTVDLASSSAPAGAERWVTLPDGRQIYLICTGAGAPAVIFDAGAGCGASAWDGVREEIGKTTQACAYDRAGLGLSDPGPLPRDAGAVAGDLDTLLLAAGIPGPYILVGHSLGSYHVRQYANTHFDKVAGMVLVDGSADGQAARFTEAAPGMMALQNTATEKRKSLNCITVIRAKLVRTDDPLTAECGGNDADRTEAYLSEIDAMDATSAQQLARSRRSWKDMPLIVLTRGDYDAG